MSPLDLREIEFQSDGLHDSLTQAMSPELFHQSLKREIASAQRGGDELVIVSLRLAPREFASVAAFQEALIKIAFALRTGLRGDDFFGRISDTGFWLLLQTPELEATGILDRLQLPYDDQITRGVVARAGLDYLEWIQRVDLTHFQ